MQVRYLRRNMFSAKFLWMDGRRSGVVRTFPSSFSPVCVCKPDTVSERELICVLRPRLAQITGLKMSAEDEAKMQDELDALNAQVTKQGAAVRQLKKGGAAADAIDEAVKALQALKISAGELQVKLKGNEPGFNRKSFDDLIIRKMFVVPSFEIHGAVKGLFDLGPPACGLKVGELAKTMNWIIFDGSSNLALPYFCLFDYIGCHD